MKSEGPIRKTGSIELVALGLLAALVVLLAVPFMNVIIQTFGGAAEKSVAIDPVG